MECQGRERVLQGRCAETTANRMELTSCVEVLKVLRRPCNVIFYTDSQNVIGWLSKGWKVRSADIIPLVEEFEGLKEGHNVTFVKVKAHSEDEYNERVDELAKQQAYLQKGVSESE